MARQRITNTTVPQAPGTFDWLTNRDKANQYHSDVSKRQVEDEHNRRVDRRQQMAEGLGIPEAMGNEFTRGVGDRVVDAESYLKSDQLKDHARTAAILGGGTLATAGLASYLGARNQQQIDYQPTDPFSVVGRMVNNGGTTGAVGLDSLAEARNKVSEARRIVGSENMLEALAADEITQMRGEQELAMTPVEYQQMAAVQGMIDQRAEQLMGQPIQKSDGSVAPMPYDQAQRIATEQVNMELRAGGAY